MKAITFHGVSDVAARPTADPKLVDADRRPAAHHDQRGVRLGPAPVPRPRRRRAGAEAAPSWATSSWAWWRRRVRRSRRCGRAIAWCCRSTVSCGHCEWCQRRLPTQCATTGRAVFGGRFGHVWGGGQAERVRVPFADHLCEKVPADMSDDDALFLGDILSTGYVCAENGGIRPGDTVAVFGAGPVGLLAMQSAQLFGPARVFAVDRVDYRLALAAEFGAEPVNLDTGDPAEQIRKRHRRPRRGRGAGVRRPRDAVHAGHPVGAGGRARCRRWASTSSRRWAFRRVRHSSRT